jgi:hypothetical protein
MPERLLMSQSRLLFFAALAVAMALITSTIFQTQGSAQPTDQTITIGVVTLSQVSAGQATSASLTTEPDKYAGIPALHVVRAQVPVSTVSKDSAVGSASVALLKGIVVDMGDGRKQTADSSGSLRVTIPPNSTTWVFDIFTTDHPDIPVGHGTVPVTGVGAVGASGSQTNNPAPAPTAAPGNRLPTSAPARPRAPVPGSTSASPGSSTPIITMPPIVTEGGVQIMHGDLSGSSAELKVLVDNEAAKIVAARPETVVWEMPKAAAPGPHHVVVWPGAERQPVEFTIHSLGLRMSADATTLLRGQSTAMHVTISGLDDLPDASWRAPSPPDELVDLGGVMKRTPELRWPQSRDRGAVVLVIENRSPQTIRMGKGGHTIVLTLHKEDFNHGVHQYNDKLQSLQSGGFNIDGTLAAFLGSIAGQVQH